MIYGIGTDIVQVKRVAGMLERHEARFIKRVLGEQERVCFEARSAQGETGKGAKDAQRGLAFLATRIAAKEAFAKALGLGMRTPMGWQSVQILNNPLGKPEIIASQKMGQWMQERGLTVEVSVSDEREYAIAFVVLVQLPLDSSVHPHLVSPEAFPL